MCRALEQFLQFHNDKGQPFKPVVSLLSIDLRGTAKLQLDARCLTEENIKLLRSRMPHTEVRGGNRQKVRGALKTSRVTLTCSM